MKLPRYKFFHFAACAAAVVSAWDSGVAQDWPSRQLTMVVGFTAGSSSDIAGRILAPRLSELLGRQVVVENIGGAGGMTVGARVAKAAPDGYQFMLGTLGTHAVNQTLYRHPLYDAASDFTPVALVADQPSVLITRKDFPAKNLQEFISYTKANQSRLQYASSGAGSAAHLCCVLLNAAIGVDVTHIPYRGGPPAMQDLMGGRIDYQCAIAATVLGQIASSEVKTLAIFSKARSPTLPNLQSAHEQGLTDFEAGTWNAVFLPKGTPAPIVQKLHAAIVGTMETPSVHQRLKEIGADLVLPQRRSPEYLAEFVVR